MRGWDGHQQRHKFLEGSTPFYWVPLLRIDLYQAKAELSRTRAKCMDNRPVSFPQWKQVPVAAALTSSQAAAYQREIITFLHHRKVSHAAATVELAEQYLSVREKRSSRPVICNALYYIST